MVALRSMRQLATLFALSCLVIVSSAWGVDNTSSQQASHAEGSADEIPLHIKQKMLAGETTEAIAWLTRAADQGHSKAALMLGNLYRLGQGVDKNPEHAVHYLQIAALGNLAQAQYQLGVVLLRQNKTEKATPWLMEAASQGHKSAKTLLQKSRSSKAREASPFTLIADHTPVEAKVYPASFWLTQSKAGDTPLIAAVAQQKTAWVLHILNSIPTAAVNTKDATGSTALHHAAKHNDTVSTRALISAGANLQISNSAGSTPLHLAVAADAVDVARLLYEQKVDTEQEDLEGWTPIMLAQRSNSSAFSFLSESVSNPKELLQNPNHALWRAIKTNDLDKVKQALEQGADPTRPTAAGLSTLNLAILYGDTAMVRLLVDAGVDVAQSPKQGPLFEAIEAKKPDLVAFLLSQRLDPNTQDQYQRNSLHRSVLAGCNACIQPLLAANVDIAARTLKGQTALLLALEADNLAATMALIGSPNSPINVADKNGRTPLWWASANNLPGVAQSLLERHARLSADNQGRTPLHIAIKNGHVDMFFQLAAAGTEEDLRHTDNRGHTLLHTAARRNDKQTIKHLINAGLEIDAPNEIGDTPLMLAVVASNLEAAEILVHAGASINRRNEALLNASTMMEQKADPAWQALLEAAPNEIESLLVRLIN